MRQVLVVGVFLGILVMADGISNDYRITNLVVGTLVLSIRDLVWFVGSLIGLTR